MSPASLEELPVWARELIKSAPLAHLGLLDDRRRPRVLPVTYAVRDDSLVTAVDHKPKRAGARELARVRWLRADPRAALTVDRYDDDWSRLAWVQAIGSVEVLEQPPAGALDALAGKYPQYRDRPPGGPFMRLVPERFLTWTALEQS